ncbi:MAG: MlaD family protein [Solirubrobacteraceae bacterium]
MSDAIAIVVLFVVAVGVSAYILSHERLRFPIVQSAPFTLKGDFSTAQAVTPGQGQTVQVSGVQIGEISGVTLTNGVAEVAMSIRPEYKDVIHTDATALLRPKTGLKDMFVELNPGLPSDRNPVVKPGYTIPIQNTLPDINPDQIFAALDADSRAYLKLLLQGAGQGLNNRGGDLREVFTRFEPTHRDLAAVNTAVATRDTYLRDAIHSLAVLNGELASKGPQLTSLVSSSAVVFNAFAQENQQVSQFVHVLPGALHQTTDTLGKVQRFADVLGPAATALQPVAVALNKANAAIQPFAREATPEINNHIRPFVRDLRPLVRNLRPAATNLAKATPQLTPSFLVLNRLFNMFAFNPNANLGPAVGGQPPRSYLFYLAWLGHVGVNLFSSADANGSFRPVTVAAPCATLKQLVAGAPQLNFLLNVTPLLSTAGVC